MLPHSPLLPEETRGGCGSDCYEGARGDRTCCFVLVEREAGQGPGQQNYCPHRTVTGTGSQQRGNSHPFLAGRIRASPSEQRLVPGCVTQIPFAPQQRVTLQTWTRHRPTSVQTPSSSPLTGQLCLWGISALWRSCPAHARARLGSVTPAPQWQ